jgi:hypothetical protein
MWIGRPEASEDLDFRDAVDVQVSETGHGLVHDTFTVSVLYVADGPIYDVLR